MTLTEMKKQDFDWQLRRLFYSSRHVTSVDNINRSGSVVLFTFIQNIKISKYRIIQKYIK